MSINELKRRKAELERRLKYLRRKFDKPVAIIGMKVTGEIVLYRNRVENNEYSFKLDEDVSVEYKQFRNFMLGKVYLVMYVYSREKSMSAPYLGYLPGTMCNNFKKNFLKTQNEYIKHKDIIDREYAGFDKLEAELQEIKDELEKLERNDVLRASNERLRKMQGFFEDMEEDSDGAK